eukprot:3432072-Rhodomonas_salina.2
MVLGRVEGAAWSRQNPRGGLPNCGSEFSSPADVVSGHSGGAARGDARTSSAFEPYGRVEARAGDDNPRSEFACAGAGWALEFIHRAMMYVSDPPSYPLLPWAPWGGYFAPPPPLGMDSVIGRCSRAGGHGGRMVGERRASVMTGS